MGNIIGVDVDLTVVDIGTDWWKWLQCICCVDKQMPEYPEYDLSTYFKEELESVNRSGYDYFRQSGLYDTLKPIEGSVECLQELSKECDIVFISKIKGHHTKSKAEFIKRFFPFYSGIVFTHEKWYVDCDFMIDDRADVLNKMSEKTTCIQYNTNYTQSEVGNYRVISLDEWHRIYNFINIMRNT